MDSTLRLSAASTPLPSACTPSMRGGQTPGPTRTGRSCTREAGRSSVPSPSCWQVPPHDPHVLQVREEDRHQDLRGQEEVVRGWLGGHSCRVLGRHLEGEVRGVVQEAFQEAAQVVRREAWQEGWRCPHSRGGGGWWRGGCCRGGVRRGGRGGGGVR